MLPDVIDPLLNIINLSVSLGYVPKTFKLAMIQPLVKKRNVIIQIYLIIGLESAFSVKDTGQSSFLTNVSVRI